MVNTTNQTKRIRADILQIADELAAKFRERAAQHDREGSFPVENFDDLRAAGFASLSVPVEYGGWGAGLLDSLLAMERIAMGDGSTALAMTMHVQTVGSSAVGERWKNGAYEGLCAEIIGRAALVNSCASEPELGSPSRGGRPSTTATRDGADGWRISGRKTFASMSPVLDYFIIPAALDGTDETARFLIPRQPGLEIEDTWDSLGMRSTGSNDLILHDVAATDRQIISQGPDRAPDPTKIAPNAWFTLIIGAVYLGVAAAAQQAALDYAQKRVPTALGKPIATLESIQRHIGQMELLLLSTRGLLYYLAGQWDAEPERRVELGPGIVAAKVTATNAAIQIVDEAMRVVGGASMTHQTPLERYYRDVRAGLFHPPADDSALPQLGRNALRRAAPPSQEPTSNGKA